MDEIYGTLDGDGYEYDVDDASSESWDYDEE